MTALLAFLATPAGQALIVSLVGTIAAAFHKTLSESATKAITDAAPIAVTAAAQLADKTTSNETKKQQAVDAVTAAVPIVARFVVPGIKKQIEAHVEAAVAAQKIGNAVSEALNGGK